MASDPHPPDSSNPRSPGPTLTRLIVIVLIVGTTLTLYSNFSESLTLANLAQKESSFRDYGDQNPVLVYGVAFLIYVSVTGMSLPGATVLTLVFAWYFRFWRGLVLVSFASTAGATLAFITSRYLFRDAIQRRFSERLDRVNKALQREGTFYLFTLRLIPAIPFFVINLVMGLTPMRVSTFWWVSQVGMLPGTAVYVYAGAQFPDLQTLAEHGPNGILSLPLLIAFVLLGIFPLAVRRILPRSESSES